MGRESRLKPGRKKNHEAPRVIRSGADVRAKFGARLDAVTANLETARKETGRTSFDERRRRAMADGVTSYADGIDGNTVGPEVATLLRLQEEMFVFKFGRSMRPDDPYFFNLDADSPQPEPTHVDDIIGRLRAAAQEVGVDPDLAVEHFMGQDELADYRRRRQ